MAGVSIRTVTVAALVVVFLCLTMVRMAMEPHDDTRSSSWSWSSAESEAPSSASTRNPGLPTNTPPTPPTPASPTKLRSAAVASADDAAPPAESVPVPEPAPVTATPPSVQPASAQNSLKNGIFASLFTPEAEASKETMWKCNSYGVWADVCVYRRLCFKGNSQLVFALDEFPKARGGRISKAMRAMGMRMSTKLPREPMGDLHPLRYVPAYYKGSSIDFATPERLSTMSPAVKWFSDRTTYITAYQEQLGNIWYYSTRILPLYTAMMYGERWGLPTMENSDVIVLGPEHKIKADYHRQVLNFSIPASASVYYASDPKYTGLNPPKGSLMCFDTAVLTGAQVYGFSDWITSHTFRSNVYRAHGIPLPKKPKNDVILLDRGSTRPRHISNVKEVTELIKSFGYSGERVVISEGEPFAQQLELFSRTGVLVAVHGAGLMNQILLPPGSAVIEVFPVHAKHVLYERVAHYAGVYHFKVYSKQFENHYHERHKEYRKNGCDKVQSLDIPESAACWQLVKNSNVVFPMPEFREALIHAIDFITRFKDPAIGDHEEGDYD